MLKWFNKNKEKKNKGFTLVELIVVIAILAILVGLLAPQYTKYVEKSRKSADVSNLENIVTGFKVAASDHEYKIGGTVDKNTTYTIVMAADGTTITASDSSDNTQFTKAIEEYTGFKFENSTKNTALGLKSKKWGEAIGDKGKDSAVTFDSTGPAIGAQVTIDNKTDAVTVIYSDNVTNYSATGKK